MTREKKVPGNPYLRGNEEQESGIKALAHEIYTHNLIELMKFTKEHVNNSQAFAIYEIAKDRMGLNEIN